MLLNCGVAEDFWESLGLQGDPTSPSQRKSVLNIHWKDWCWSWSSSTKPPDGKSWLWKRPWCWERLKAGGEGGNRGWNGWMASPNQWTWVWANSRSWWRTGRPGVQSMGSQRFRHNWVTEQHQNVSICKFYSVKFIKFLNVVAGFLKMLQFKVQHMATYINLK